MAVEGPETMSDSREVLALKALIQSHADKYEKLAQDAHEVRDYADEGRLRERQVAVLSLLGDLLKLPIAGTPHPEQEPVAVVEADDGEMWIRPLVKDIPWGTQLFTTPQPHGGREGWVWVPKKPTEAMLSAMTDGFLSINGNTRDEFFAGYKAMLSAAPTSQPEQREGESNKPLQVYGDAKVHKLKVLSQFYEALETGEKTFELRKDDRGFKAGDFLLLQEWDSKTGYSGRSVKRLVTYLLAGHPWLAKDYVAMALSPFEQAARQSGG